MVAGQIWCDGFGMAKIVTLAPTRPARLSAKLREAIRLHVTEGRTISDACREAGLSRAGWHAAMKRAPVRDHLEQVRASFISGVDARRAFYKAAALEQAMWLMKNAKSEAIRARMAEFLAADAKVSPVAVHIDARATGQGGYIYRRPDDLTAIAGAPANGSDASGSAQPDTTVGDA